MFPNVGHSKLNVGLIMLLLYVPVACLYITGGRECSMTVFAAGHCFHGVFSFSFFCAFLQNLVLVLLVSNACHC